MNHKILKRVYCLFIAGARVRIESEIQRGQVHNRTGSYGEGERVGLGARSAGPRARQRVYQAGL